MNVRFRRRPMNSGCRSSLRESSVMITILLINCLLLTSTSALLQQVNYSTVDSNINQSEANPRGPKPPETTNLTSNYDDDSIKYTTVIVVPALPSSESKIEPVAYGSGSSPRPTTSNGRQEEYLNDDENTTLLIGFNQQSYQSSTTDSVSSPKSVDKVTIEGEPSSSSEIQMNRIYETTRSSSLKRLNQEEDSNHAPSRGPKKLGPEVTKKKSRQPPNSSDILSSLFKKKPYSKYWSVEQKWDDIFKRFLAVQESLRGMMTKDFLRGVEYYTDVTISSRCAEDLRYIQSYLKNSTNMRWLTHMFDSTGKSEPGMLTGNMANLGHVVQCIKVRAPARPSNDSFNERYFEISSSKLGERFRGKYCLASIRPILPEKPYLVSRFSKILDTSLLSNISYMGQDVAILKRKINDDFVPESEYDLIDRDHYRLDQVPFESELYQYLISSSNFIYSLPRFMGVCYPSSCSRDDIRHSIQKAYDDQHQVVDIEFDCEVEESDAREWFTTPRSIVYVFLTLIVTISFGASLARHILVDRLQLKRRSDKDGKLFGFINSLDIISMDKCAGILFVKTRPATTLVDESKLENNRSTSIDALKGLLTLMLVYSELIHLGCLPVPFMWSKWSDSMFAFFRSYLTQIFLNTSIWTEAFYMISAYLIGFKLLEGYRPKIKNKISQQSGIPPFSGFVITRYIRLTLPMMAIILFNYVWPRLSNGFVMQDQANKLLSPCDKYAWTNMLMFHNHHGMNETCLWPTHVSASFFQLHLLSYPIIVLLLISLRTMVDSVGARILIHHVITWFGLGLASVLALFGLVYPALIARDQGLIVPFLIDYIDYDNYQRVIEWTVMPTYNHLTSYMLGLILAYAIVRSRMNQETQEEFNSSECQGVLLHREGSLESVTSSSTQGLNFKPAFMMHNVKLNRLASSRSESIAGSNQDKRTINLIYQVIFEIIMVLILLASLTASWYWNGLGQPMSFDQVFWYMIGTKLTFNLAFVYFFYRYFATRRNSSNPWMITRFLVPIGRMSLMLFYVSWPVIWFDLLSSLYQWHPSHYFVFEKYNEIILMSLVISMFAYGTFEGTFKILQYKRKADKLKRFQAKKQGETKSSSDGLSLRELNYSQGGFESLFQPIDTDIEAKSVADYSQTNRMTKSSYQLEATKLSGSNNQMFSKGSSMVIVHQGENKPTPPGAKVIRDRGTGLSEIRATTKGSSGVRHLSIADQYKLNAELRANYSFASIGLYESAGAIDDLPSGSNDPQVSPAQTDKKAH